MTLINEWKTFYKHWSTWLIAFGSSIATFSPELSEALLYAWNLLPMDIKTTFPPEVVRYVGYGIAILAIPAKLIRQPKLYKEANKSAKP